MNNIADFAAARLPDWTGLPAGLTVDAFAAYGVQPAQRLPGEIGDPPRRATWLALDSTVYEAGLRIWLGDNDEVLLVDGEFPVDEDGEPMTAPDLGPPEAAFEAVLDTLILDGGERVYAARGLALRVNPGNGLLLGARGFVPTSVEDYRTRLRPVLEPRRRMTGALR